MFSKELRERREKMDMSLREASERTKGQVSYAMLHRYEHGQGLDGMSVHHLRAISKLFRWNMGDMTKKIAAEQGGARAC